MREKAWCYEYTVRALTARVSTNAIKAAPENGIVNDIDGARLTEP
jgi:hypothetical protein